MQTWFKQLMLLIMCKINKKKNKTKQNQHISLLNNKLILILSDARYICY